MAIIWVGTGRFSAYIGPVQDYIDRVVAADVAAGNTLGLEVGVRDAYDVFIRDSINVGDLGTSGGVLSQANSIIKAAPIMAGARTLAGALVPLVGPAPTNFNFVAGDYDRKTGLKGSLSTEKSLEISSPGDVLNNTSYGFYLVEASSSASTDRSFMGAGNNGRINPNGVARVQDASNTVFSGMNTAPGLKAGLRDPSRIGTKIAYAAGQENTTSVAATGTIANTILFARATGIQFQVDARISFYWLGQYLNAPLLDARVTTLMNAIAAAIP